MKRLLTMFLAVVLVVSMVSVINAEACTVGNITVLTSKSGKTVTLSIKNTNNKSNKSATLQLQKKTDGNWKNKNSFTKTVKPNKTEKVKKTLSKGTYRYKVTSSGKTGYTTVVTIK